MKTVLPFRRLLACWVAISVATAGFAPRCEAMSVAAEVARPCYCGCPGECRCGDACTCLARHPAPVRPATPEKVDDPRLVLGLNVATVVAALAEAVAAQGSFGPATTQAGFPSLRTLNVRIQT